MKRRLTTLLLALAILAGLAVPAAAADTPRGTLTYTEIISPKYEDAGFFGNGLAPVKQNGKWGYIDAAGKVVIPFEYEMAYCFNEGLAVVATNLHPPYDGAAYQNVDIGYIDATGRYTPFRTAEGSQFEWPLDSGFGNNLPQYPSDVLFHNGFARFSAEYGTDLFGTDGKQVGTSGNVPLGPVNEGLYPFYTMEGGAPGWADTTGKIVKLFPKWDDAAWGKASDISNVYSFNQGLAPVWRVTGTDANGEPIYKCGFMNRSYQWVIPAQFDEFYFQGVITTQRLFGDTGIAMVAKNSKWGGVDKSGKTVIPFQYDGLHCDSEGLIGFKQGGKWGFMDAATLKVVIPARFQLVSMFNDGLAAVYDGSKAYIIDRAGKAVPGADALDASSYFRDDDTNTIYQPDEYMLIQKNGKYGFGKIEYLQPLPDKSEMSGWAYQEVTAAIEEDLVPSALQNLYRNDIRRDEFCDLLVQALEEMSGKSIQDLVKEKTGKDLYALQRAVPFQDTNSANIVAANALGIVTGRGSGKFDPYATITRQEAAALLMRAAKVLGMDTANPASAGFADDAKLASWGREAVNFVAQIGVMNGVSKHNFAPAGTYTREQSYVTIYRLFEAVSES